MRDLLQFVSQALKTSSSTSDKSRAYCDVSSPKFDLVMSPTKNRIRERSIGLSPVVARSNVTRVLYAPSTLLFRQKTLASGYVFSIDAKT